ncbi:MAG TPA: HAMP domain-containing sensor histidine kinase [Myxococcaceae bacterium]|jgi:signal transduction histidine kinase
MLRRLLPTLVALGCGLLALGWGLVTLQRIFAQETRDARQQLHARRDELERQASEALRQKLKQRLADSHSSIQKAVEDPLAQADGLYLFFRGYQFLPRLPRPRPGAQTPAKLMYGEFGQLLSASSVQGPWQQRLDLLRAAEAALTGNNPQLAEGHLETLLRYRAENPLRATEEIPFTLLVAERLQRGAAWMPLVRELVSGGLPDEFGGAASGAGLQRDLLRECQRFTQPDFDFLYERILRLSQELGVSTDDFKARVQELGAGALVIPATFTEPALVGERWYMEADKEIVRGIAVDLDEVLRTITLELREKKLFDPEDEVRPGPTQAVQPVSTVQLEMVMPRWAATEKDISERYGLKTLLVAACGALAVAIVLVAVLAQHRKYRFLELKSDFVATVSHELRTPLASIRLLAETLERKARNTPEVRDYPGRIIQAADGLHFLVENILSFNRIDKGRWAAQFTQVRLEELVGSLRTDVDGATNVPVQVTSDVGEIELKADPTLLRLLFSNLGRNACAYNRRNPVELSVRAHAVPGHGCTVLFGDNGIGIPRNEWESVFQDFYRLTQQGPEVHGSGLGLALCRRIMHLHGGTMRIASSGPEGTTFALMFPEPRR